MAKMKSSLAFILFLVDIFGGIAVLVLSIIIIATESMKIKTSQIAEIPNLRGSKLNLNEIHSQIKGQEKKNEMNLSNLDGDKFVLFIKQKSSLSSPKRKLENSEEEIELSIIVVLLLDVLALHFVFAIGFSFIVDQNECCRNFNDCFFFTFALCIFNISITYCSVQACGKHISRYVGVTSVMLISIINFIFTCILMSNPYCDQGLMISVLVIPA